MPSTIRLTVPGPVADIRPPGPLEQHNLISERDHTGSREPWYMLCKLKCLDQRITASSRAAKCPAASKHNSRPSAATIVPDIRYCSRESANSLSTNPITRRACRYRRSLCRAGGLRLPKPYPARNFLPTETGSGRVLIDDFCHMQATNADFEMMAKPVAAATQAIIPW
ncbi:MAG: hypothetical protein JWR21_3716 [Herminiimonas sp.]|nr:hypothetical protein [Herminiimonas sp.]